MHRFYLPASECREATLQLSERDAKHALKVLRLREGERISVLDGEGHEYLCQIDSLEKNAVSARVLSRNTLPQLDYELVLLQAIVKGKSMDLIIQKATELGCTQIIPVLSERTVVQCDADEVKSKQEKWQTLAIEAMKQCGQAWLPRVQAPTGLDQALVVAQNGGPALTLLASLQPGAQHPRVHIDQHRADHQHAPKRIVACIGPEGDFTPAEINAIKGCGALPITLGSLILRSETAAIYTLSVLNYEMQAPATEPGS